MSNIKYFAAVFVAAFLIHVSNAQADILWEQAPDGSGTGVVDQEFSDFPTFSTYLVNDVTFAGDVNISAVTTYFTNNFSGGGFVTGTTARLNIFSNDPLQASDDPTVGASVTVVITETGSHLTVTASGLNIDLLAGDYWIGLTPVLDQATFGQEFHVNAAVVGDLTQARNPGGGFGFGSDWTDATDFVRATDFEGALLVEGSSRVIDIPEPASLAIFGIGLAGLGLISRRRRKKNLMA